MAGKLNVGQESSGNAQDGWGGRRQARFAPIQPSSRRQQVADALREAIISGSLKPGEQLKQDELGREFGVSPAPVREAMRQLESEGLVVHRPNSGVFVDDPSIDDLLGIILPVRVVIENYALRRAITRLTPQDFDQLEHLVLVMQAGAAINDINTINDADIRFHEVTVMASGSSQAIQLWRSVLPRMRLHVAQFAPKHQPAEEIAAEHSELLDVLKSKDESAIEVAVEEHIVGTTQRLLRSGTPQARRQNPAVNTHRNGQRPGETNLRDARDASPRGPAQAHHSHPHEAKPFGRTNRAE